MKKGLAKTTIMVSDETVQVLRIDKDNAQFEYVLQNDLEYIARFLSDEIAIATLDKGIELPRIFERARIVYSIIDNLKEEAKFLQVIDADTIEYLKMLSELSFVVETTLGNMVNNR